MSAKMTALCAVACALLAGSARAQTSAVIGASLSPDRLGAKASLTIALRYAGGEAGVPSPVRRSVLRLPVGMNIYLPSLRSCAATRLLADGAKGCPSRSRLGGGRALVETLAGSQIISENVTLRAFLGPPDNLRPTFEILAEGDTPVHERVIFSGSVRSGSAPYGEELVMSIPSVPTLPLEPDASVVSFSLTVGGKTRSSVRVPSACPAGGFPFAGEFTYADGSHASVVASVPCPR